MPKRHEHQIGNRRLSCNAGKPCTVCATFFVPRDRRKPHVHALASPERGGGFCTAKSGGVTWYTDCIVRWSVSTEVSILSTLRTWYTDCIDCIAGGSRRRVCELTHVVHGLHLKMQNLPTNDILVHLRTWYTDCIQDVFLSHADFDEIV